MNWLIVVRPLALVCTGLVAGIFLGHRAGVSQAGPRLPPPTFIQLQQLIHVVFARMMPPLVAGAVVFSTAWVITLRGGPTRPLLWLVGPACVALVFAAVLTRAVKIQLNAQLMTWNIEAPPADFRQRWQPWERVHSRRMVLVFVAFALEAFAMSSAQGPG